MGSSTDTHFEFTSLGYTYVADRWFKNGDHPLDFATPRSTYGGGQLSVVSGEEAKRLDWEGAVVRRFRRPGVPGLSACVYCGSVHDNHGWIDRGPDGLMVCPGSWVVRRPDGHYHVESDRMMQDRRRTLAAIAQQPVPSTILPIGEYQPLPVHGYKPQAQDKVDMVNALKEAEERALRALDGINSDDVDIRWLSIARTHIQQGFMAAARAVFQPDRIKLPEDEV